MAPDVVGRAAELALITSVLEGRAGTSRLLLEGDPGIGKTTLVNAAVARAAALGHRVLRARPAEPEGGLPFCTLGDLLRPVLPSALEALPGPQRRALEVALQRIAPGPDGADRLAIARALVAILQGAVGPVTTIVIDDVQWVDAPTAEVLAFALRRVPDPSLRVLLARRGADTALPFGLDGESGFARIVVGPLGTDDLDRILRDQLGLQLDRPQLARLDAATGGNPYFALELLRANPLLASGAGRAWPLNVPDSLGGLLRTRLRALPRAGLDAVVLAASSAHPTGELLAALATPAGLRAAIAEGLLVAEGARVQFAHPLIASVAYADAAPAVRRRAHARLAAALADDDQRAMHLGRATERPDEAVASNLAAAAARFQLRGAPAIAAELASHAWRLTPTEAAEHRAERLAESAEYHLAAGETVAGRTFLEGAVAASLPVDRRAQLLIRLGHVEYVTGDVLAAHRAFDEALRLAGPGTASGAAAQQALAFTSMFAGDIATALDSAGSALETAERLAEPALVSGALGRAALLRFLAGRGIDHVAFRRAILLEDAIRNAPTEWTPSFAYAGVLCYADAYDASRAIYERLRVAALETGDERAIPTILFAESQMESAAGNVGLGQALAREAVARTRQSGLAGLRANALSADVIAAVLAGEVDRARTSAEDGLRLAAKAGAGAPATWIVAAIGSLELALGDAQAANRQFGPLAATVARYGIGDPGVVRFLPDAVEALIVTGDRDEAERLLTIFEGRAEALDRPGARAAAARCRALLEIAAGELVAAETSLGRALAEHSRVGQPVDRARTLLVLGSLLRRRRQPAAARAILLEALGVLEHCGASLWAARVRAELARLPARAAAPDDLTETERVIARLVAIGRTNREVATALSIAVRTVEWNLSKIYAKLGVRSRTELAAQLGRRRH